MDVPLELRDLSKSYGTLKAVAGVSFSLQKGTVFGLIGPDGAGKTTIMRMLASLLYPDGGSAFLLGKNIHKNTAYVRKTVGYMPQRFSLYQDLTVAQNLNFFSDIFGIPHSRKAALIDKLYSFSGLAPFAKRHARDLSGGMKQKLALSCILLHSPPVLILDEPTFGVDPLSRQELWTILHGLASEGTSILVSTPYMDEAAQCDHIGLIHEGVIIASGTPQSVVDTFAQTAITVIAEQPYRTYKQLREARLPGDVFLFGEGVHIIGSEHLTREMVVRTLTEGHIPHTEVRLSRPGLEDIFLALITHAGKNT